MLLGSHDGDLSGCPGSQQAQVCGSVMPRSGLTPVKMMFITIQAPEQLQGDSTKLSDCDIFETMCQSIALCLAQENLAKSSWHFTADDKILGTEQQCC